MINKLSSLCLDGRLRPLDVQFAKQMRTLCLPELTEQEKDVVTLISAYLSNEYSKSNICLPFTKVEEPEYFGKNSWLLLDGLPEKGLWGEIFNKSGVCGNGGKVTPIVFDKCRMYIYRNWLMEQNVAAKIMQMSKSKAQTPKQLLKMKRTLNRLFARNYKLLAKALPAKQAENDDDLFMFVCDFFDVKEELLHSLPKAEIVKLCRGKPTLVNLKKLNKLLPEVTNLNWQKVSAGVALTRQFTVISGGPGTGKTTTVSKMLAALCELSEKPDLNIKLCAPTGKAAARLTESITAAMSQLPISADVLKLIPKEASTIHRLLGAVYKKADFRHNTKNKLHLDVLVIDEASMIDLSLMSKLLDALPDDAIIILLGDKDQLASVEAGSVLGDICSFIVDGVSDGQKAIIDKITGFDMEKSNSANEFTDSLCMLRKSYRFHKNSGVGQLAYATNDGNPSRIKSVIDFGYKDLTFTELSSANYTLFIKDVAKEYEVYLNLIANNSAPLDVIKEFTDIRILCATREGECGLNAVNDKIETLLDTKGKIARSNTSAWYVGRPVMITKNDHALGLFNGDIGICMRDEDQKLYVFFEAADNNVRRFLPSRLPDHETIYAMTIHKSQGSEFGRTFMLLPEKMSPLLTRELVYTGFTRAKTDLRVCCLLPVLLKAASIKTKRDSGLIDLLAS
ncbi:exodeoxyribonuclease V subunit alpha [Vibrio coralliirubri]|uniref:exodeoxyribonuclease V subunit alpha n=1 Tax=Vibrio coralliirubri TaxID=1516159 RepID=UPI002283C941|nr:exodeoxyribonuclease V subunit alpha [Vibrio coralliirubri]MCY9861285.1 exodeoxyribonuclease V subunit alpha [Vibrio coralliirubri]